MRPRLGYNQRESVDVSESNRITEHNADCVLILKRTYILKEKKQLDEWGDKFVFNDIDSDEVKKKIHKSDLCIKRIDVDKAIEEAKHKMKFETPDDIDNLEVSDKSISSVAELNLATGQLLTKKFDLTHDEILNALPMIDMSTSKLFWNDLCPKHVRPMICSKSRYRTITAHCNNLKHPSWGATKTPYSRYLPPDYADGLNLPRASQNGQPLPSARLISSIVHRDSDEPSNDYSTAFASWGQLLNHDVTRAAVGEAPDCCPQYLKGPCMPIPVPPMDPLYSKHNVKCLKFDRSLAAMRPKCLLGLRAQINTVTSPVDASFVYGSSKSQAARLRSFQDGKMKVTNYFEKLKLKPLLPPKLEKPDEDCMGRPKSLFCFEAGDVRVNEQTQLTVLHTVYVREHNRIAKQLARMNIDWDDDKIYHETRHIVAACVQHIMVNEFLPLLLGHKYLNEYKLKPQSAAQAKDWTGYDPSVTTSTGTGFAAAAFRYGHSMVEGVIKRIDKHGHFIKGELLRFLFKRPFLLYEPGVMDQLIIGMVLTPTEQTDPHVSEELSGHLFQPPKAKFGHDLAAINIQRGRDQGVPGYNDWREWCGLSRAKSFGDLEPLLMNKTAYQYSKIYKHVDDIDLWSAGIAERKMANSAVGPTMACIIARQFLNTKRGDRFWYENSNQLSSFTQAQLKEIKKATLAKLLCMNGDDIPKIQPWAMRLPHPIYNAKVPCESLPGLNLKLWATNDE